MVDTCTCSVGLLGATRECLSFRSFVIVITMSDGEYSNQGLLLRVWWPQGWTYREADCPSSDMGDPRDELPVRGVI